MGKSAITTPMAMATAIGTVTGMGTAAGTRHPRTAAPTTVVRVGTTGVAILAAANTSASTMAAAAAAGTIRAAMAVAAPSRNSRGWIRRLAPVASALVVGPSAGQMRSTRVKTNFATLHVHPELEVLQYDIKFGTVIKTVEGRQDTGRSISASNS